MGRISQLDATGVMAPSVEKYQLAFIRPYHREIARRIVLGEKQSEVARSMQIDEGRLSIICNSPAFRAEVARLETQRERGTVDVTVQLQELAPVALEAVERTMIYGSKESIRFDAAKDLLDRAGYGKINKVDAAVVVETHEQRLARLTGVPVEDVAMTPTTYKPEEINITPTGDQGMSTSGGMAVDEYDTTHE